VSSLLAAADCFVSLRRSEGFGLSIAEAVYLGKPVIVTAYSGNMDFTREGNAFLVGYEPRPVGPGNSPYPERALWAEPSIEETACLMRKLAADEPLRRKTALAGQAFIKKHLSLERIGRMMAERLLEPRRWPLWFAERANPRSSSCRVRLGSVHRIS